MTDFDLYLQLRDGTYIGSVPFYDLQGEFRMNEPDELRFNFVNLDVANYIDPAMLEEGLTEVVLMRNGIKIFVGPIWDITASSDAGKINLVANDVSSYLKHRRVSSDIKFTKKQYGYAVWKIISDSQAMDYGNLGITLGNNPTTASGSFTYTKKSGTVLYTAITKLAEGTNGFDWEITPERVLNIYYPRLQSTANIVLHYPTNINKYSLQGMGSFVANDVFIRGGGKFVSDVYRDTTSLAKYGLRQYTKSDSGLKSKAKVDALAKQELINRKGSKRTPQLTVDSSQINPFEGDLTYGNIVQTTIKDGWAQFDGPMRYTGCQLSIGKHGQETLVLYMSDPREVKDVIE